MTSDTPTSSWIRVEEATFRGWQIAAIVGWLVAVAVIIAMIYFGFDADARRARDAAMVVMMFKERDIPYLKPTDEATPAERRMCLLINDERRRWWQDQDHRGMEYVMHNQGPLWGWMEEFPHLKPEHENP